MNYAKGYYVMVLLYLYQSCNAALLRLRGQVEGQAATKIQQDATLKDEPVILRIEKYDDDGIKSITYQQKHSSTLSILKTTYFPQQQKHFACKLVFIPGQPEYALEMVPDAADCYQFLEEQWHKQEGIEADTDVIISIPSPKRQNSPQSICNNCCIQ